MQHSDHLISVALGAPHEPAGIVALHRTETLGPWNARRKRYDVVPSYRVTSIVAEPRAGSYAEVVERVAGLVPAVKGRQRLVVLADVTEAGRAILELLRAEGVKPVPVVVASAIGAKAAGRHVQVGEAELVARVGIVFGEDRIAIDPALPCARELAGQLERYSAAKAKRGPAAMVEFVKPERVELVRALSIGLWWGDRQMAPRLDRPRPPPQPIDCRPPTFNELMQRGR